jgi:hypothetical protein
VGLSGQRGGDFFEVGAEVGGGDYGAGQAAFVSAVAAGGDRAAVAGLVTYLIGA